MKKIKVLIVEDSPFMQKIISSLITTDQEIEVIGYAENPNVAREKIKALNPDVITLDVEMPEMSGITFVEKIMRLRPMPILMVSSVTKKNSMAAIEALELGAFDFVQKPENPSEFDAFGPELILKIKQAANSKIENLSKYKQNKTNLTTLNAVSINIAANMIVIGSSTGGIDALGVVLRNLEKEILPMVIVQHLPHTFVESFANHIHRIANKKTVLAEHNMKLELNYIYIAPANFQLGIKKMSADVFMFEKQNMLPMCGHIPSVDYLFLSVAECNKDRVLSILLTGMGKDGANGMLAIKKAGGLTVAQDQSSSVVWGMPGSAVKLNAVDYILSLEEIPDIINMVVRKSLGGSYAQSYTNF